MVWSDKIEAIVQLEPLVVLGGLELISYLFYKIALRRVRDDRHRLLQGLFKNILAHSAALGVFFLIYYVGGSLFSDGGSIASVVESRLLPYVGFLAIIWGSIVFVKVARIFAFEYLFLVSMEAGVPVLLVNILSLAISVALASWIAVAVFGIHVVPLLTTSALISVILGLALQDTLGNLFAGVALQFDKRYEIGDWIEVNNSGDKWVGQVHEITWRSTVLIGVLEDLITIPNRLIAQSEVGTWGGGGKPFWRALSYRIPFGQPVERVRATILNSISVVSEVKKTSEPKVFLNEIGESWLNFRVVFAIDDYGSQFRIVDKVNTAILAALVENKIPVATPAMRVEMMQEK